MTDYETRFAGITRLYGTDGLRRLRAAHVCIVGIGGVGCWTVEALARSGVGKLTLIDLDEVCVSNMNRQLHALDNSVGRPKVSVMAERIREINPECEIQAAQEFFTAETEARLLTTRYDFVVDAIDNVLNKCLLIACCRERNMPTVVCGGAGGRRDGTLVRVADLAHATHDRLLRSVRDLLRKDFGFPRGDKKLGVDCVFSPEPPVFPNMDGSVCAQRPEMNRAGNEEPLRLNCNWGLGSATYVTGAFGFAAAGLVVRRLAEPGNSQTSEEAEKIHLRLSGE